MYACMQYCYLSNVHIESCLPQTKILLKDGSMEATTVALLKKSFEVGAQCDARSLMAARALVLDVVGVAIAGSATAEGKAVYSTVRDIGRSGHVPTVVLPGEFD